MEWWTAGTYGLVLAVLEHVLGEVEDIPRECNVAVIALVLNGRTTDTLGAANETSVLRLEVALSHTCLDDVLAKIFEAGLGVLRLRLLDVAMTALDARGCQPGTSKVKV